MKPCTNDLHRGAGPRAWRPALRKWRVLPLLVWPLLFTQVHAQEGSAQALAQQYQGLRQQLGSSALGVPVTIHSSEQEEQLHGEVFALLEQPFGRLQQHMVSPSQWCQMILLHLNVSACTRAQTSGQDGITFYSGGKANVLLEKAYPLRFQFQVSDASPAHMEVQLRAEQGPFGTSDYRISLSAIPVAQGSFIRFSYSFRPSVASSLATRVYLATAGRDKIGFTVVGQAADGSPRYIGGTRGIAERNAVRYYFALQAHMESLDVPAGQRFAHASARWFDLTERYPAQLHEVERQDYLAAKKLEMQEQDRLQKERDAQSPMADPQAINQTPQGKKP
jgi:hypothetical protein